MTRLRYAARLAAALALAGTLAWHAGAQSPPATAIRETDLRQFLGYISADQMMGRQTFTEGYGLAAGYVAAHLEQWGVKPLGENGTYFQTVRLNDVDVSSDRSSLTVEINGQSKTFRNGDGVRFDAPLGGKQTLTIKGAEFVGYGLYLAGHDDYAGRTVKGKPVIWIDGMPSDVPAATARLMRQRDLHATAEASGAASIAYSPFDSAPRPATARAAQPPPGRGRLMVETVLSTPRQGDFVTTQNVNRLNPPQLTGGDELFEWLFSGAPKSFSEIKALAANRQPLPGFSLPDVTMTFNIDATYEVLHTLLTHNVVGMVEGSDARLKDTYVMVGAHLDHIGYRASPADRLTYGSASCPSADPNDLIANGADDDGSGTVTELAIAKAFATGARPRRSVVFIWHAGEEQGLLGSEYNADFPVVPLEKVDAEINMDMIGRDHSDDRDGDYRNSVFVVGADRISTDLHNVVVDANGTLSQPLTLDFALNDPADPERAYYRSDHYSYASKGIPVAFFSTGLHEDYHCASDTAAKIHWDKLVRVAELIRLTVAGVANRDALLVRDNRGPRAGRGWQGRIGR
jgi:hypothetical protein